MKFVLSVLGLVFCFALAGGSRSADATPTPISAPAEVDPAGIADDGGTAIETCGGNVCGKGTWCCNASCGRCVPIGMQCTQEAC